MQLNELRPNAGSTEKSWRKGRGHGSGNGKTAGKGHKGQNSRSGGGVRPGFEGGQMPLYRRLPKRGFKNRNRLDFVAINVQTLELFDNGAVVDAVALAQAGLVKNSRDGIVILGEGNLTKKLNVKAVRFSATAREKIEAAGGTVEVI